MYSVIRSPETTFIQSVGLEFNNSVITTPLLLFTNEALVNPFADNFPEEQFEVSQNSHC